MLVDEEKLLTDVPVVVLDTETTGLHAWLGHRIVELAAVRYENWKPIAQMSQLLNPDRGMEPSASEVNQIFDADLVDQPRFADVAAEFLELVDGALIVAHNAPFDAGFIGVEMRLAGLAAATEPPQPILENPWLDTLKLARGYFHFGRNNLSFVAQSLGVRVGKAHRALNDVEMTAEVLRRMYQQLTKKMKLATVGDLLHAQGGAVYTPPKPSAELPAPFPDALAQKQRVRIQYKGKEATTTRIIQPRYVTEYKKSTYIAAWCELRHEQRTFRVDRIQHATLISNASD